MWLTSPSLLQPSPLHGILPRRIFDLDCHFNYMGNTARVREMKEDLLIRVPSSSAGRDPTLPSFPWYRGDRKVAGAHTQVKY